MPWKRSLDSVLADSHKGSVGWRKTPEREKLFSYTDSLFNSEVVFFHRMGTRFDWQEIDDVGHLKVGVTLGYLAEKDLGPVTRRNGGKLDVAPTDVSNLLKLIDGRIDIFPCSKEVCYYLLRTQFLPGAADQIGHPPETLLFQRPARIICQERSRSPQAHRGFQPGPEATSGKRKICPISRRIPARRVCSTVTKIPLRQRQTICRPQFRTKPRAPDAPSNPPFDFSRPYATCRASAAHQSANSSFGEYPCLTISPWSCFDPSIPKM